MSVISKEFQKSGKPTTAKEGRMRAWGHGFQSREMACRSHCKNNDIRFLQDIE